MPHPPRIPCGPARPARRRKRRSHPNLRNALAAMLCLVTLGGVPPTGDVELATPASPARSPARDAGAAPSSARYAALFDRSPTLEAAARTGWQEAGLGSSFQRAAPQPVVTLAALEPLGAPAAQAAARPVPVPEAVQRARIVPMPMSRPADLLAQASAPRVSERRVLQRTRMATTAAATAETPSFFEALFSARKDTGPALAYAAIETEGLDRSRGRLIPGAEATPGAGTATYDISARTVRLPSGEVLEAHSGLGAGMDNPDFVHLRMRGATPPGTYDLTEREQRFHGVRALRLNPVGGSAAIHGRDGILAHTYMLGPSGASNGCVSFRDYDRFLQAYLRGEVRRLVVVSGRRQDGPSRLATR